LTSTTEPRPDRKEGRIRALGLTSGGLDSLLALLVLRSQGIEVEALTFVSPFLKPDSPRRGCAAIRVPLRVVDFTEEHIQVVRSPRFGHGSQMNPCLDCHALMFKLAHRIREEEGFHFIFTGEVLGQRPMSQNRGSLNLVARESGAPELLLRPLSAKRLKKTRPEEQGWVDRERLLDFHGRNRKPQMALARELGLTDYPTPAGGCPLTDPGFSRRLRNLLEFQPQAGPAEMELLRLGRHFHLGGGAKLVLGRNMSENERLAARAPEGAPILKAMGVPGPLGVISDPAGPPEEPSARAELFSLAGRILLAYADSEGKEGLVQLSTAGRSDQTLELRLPVIDKQAFTPRLIV